MKAPRLIIDPNPCNRYRWPDDPRSTSYNGGHCCGKKGGPRGPCKCCVGDREASGPERATADDVSSVPTFTVGGHDADANTDARDPS